MRNTTMFPTTSTRNTVPFTVPNEADVLCGRGLRNFQHPGNCKLRKHIMANTPSFAKCKYRREKTRIIDSVIKSVMREGGRFLKYDYGAKRWYDGGFLAAKQRVGIAFRDAKSSSKMKRYRFEAKGDWENDFGNYISSSSSSDDSRLALVSEIGFETSPFPPWMDNAMALEPYHVHATDANRDTEISCTAAKALMEVLSDETHISDGNLDFTCELSIVEAETWMQVLFDETQATDGNCDDTCEVSITEAETWMQVLLDDTYASSDEQRSYVIPSAVAYYERAYDLASPSKFPENASTIR
jgi:hypothetical protein